MDFPKGGIEHGLDLRERLHRISGGFCAPGWGDFSDYELRYAFELAVENEWPDALVDEILDERNRLILKFGKTIRMDFEFAIPPINFITELKCFPCA